MARAEVKLAEPQPQPRFESVTLVLSEKEAQVLRDLHHFGVCGFGDRSFMENIADALTEAGIDPSESRSFVGKITYNP